MSFQTESYVRLSEEMVFKLDVIGSSISDPTTHKKLVEGGIDLMYGNALRNLYLDDEITLDGLNEGLTHLEDYHSEVVRERILEAQNNK